MWYLGHWAKLCRSGKPPTRSNWTRGRQGRVDALTHPSDQDNHPTDSMDRNDFASDKVFSSITISSLDGPPHATNTEAFTIIDIICPSLNGQQKLKAKIDTGAGGNTLPIRIIEDMYPHGRYKTIIKPCHVRLTAYNGSEIRCIGTVDITCHYKVRAGSTSSSTSSMSQGQPFLDFEAAHSWMSWPFTPLSPPDHPPGNPLCLNPRLSTV